MSLTQATIAEIEERYWREIDRYTKLAEYVAQICLQEVVKENAIRATVSWRAKSRLSLADKLQKWTTLPGKKDINTADQAFAEIKDLAGVRVSTYVEDHRDRVVQLIKQRFVGPGGNPVESTTLDTSDSFYRATHCQVAIKQEQLIGRYENLGNLTCEVQVTSLLAHVWNEIEHDLGYKPLAGDLSIVEQSLIRVGHLTKAGDLSVVELYRATDSRLKKRDGTFKDVYDFVARAQPFFPGADEFGTNAGQLLTALQKLNLDSPKLIEQMLLAKHNKQHEHAAQDIFSKMEQFLIANNANFDLNAKSSDLLLMLLFKERASEVVDAFPAGWGQGRPARIRSLATRYQQMLK